MASTFYWHELHEKCPYKFSLRHLEPCRFSVFKKSHFHDELGGAYLKNDSTNIKDFDIVGFVFSSSFLKLMFNKSNVIEIKL